MMYPTLVARIVWLLLRWWRHDVHHNTACENPWECQVATLLESSKGLTSGASVRTKFIAHEGMVEVITRVGRCVWDWDCFHRGTELSYDIDYFWDVAGVKVVERLRFNRANTWWLWKPAIILQARALGWEISDSDRLAQLCKALLFSPLPIRFFWMRDCSLRCC